MTATETPRANKARRGLWELSERHLIPNGVVAPKPIAEANKLTGKSPPVRRPPPAG